ncbi:hypothetical protein IWQ60_003707 [Tieghemiomyces parasiticus]|uniref:ATP-grasp domain-containing protein n=1 Tax=Tieghemiomyces parasiticus TaxID=78921 RepID=A0A9W8A9P5_9FUNG|nr:hypothetical protein IWQ60_003707 [Tieghemiomyces parasiticus]
MSEAVSHPTNVLVLGSGGREHAIAWKLAQSPKVDHIFVAPGNGGTASVSPKVTNITVEGPGFTSLIKFALAHSVSLVIPGPEQPLVEGATDLFKRAGIPCFGPSLRAAAMEGSKAFSKDFMQRHQIPTAAYRNFTDYEAACAYVRSVDHDVVIKASGLAAGKGVLMPQSQEEALAALRSVMVDREFGVAGDEVVVEELLTGQEISVLAFADGYTIYQCPPAQDHKRAYDGDQGPNTGGMGCYAPAPVASAELLDEVQRSILQPTIDGMRREGFPFVGMLFTGLMLTPQGPKVLEYNVRFGDPETEVILPLLAPTCDLYDVFTACVEGRLDSVKLEFTQASAATVVMASAGYPGAYPKGLPISLGPLGPDTLVFHAGTQTDGDRVVTSGGRVLTVTGVGETLPLALATAYAGAQLISFEGAFYRRDIGHRAIAYLEAREEAGKAAGPGLTYADAGVNIDAGNELIDRIRAEVKSTRRPGTDSELGGFGGLFDLKATGFRDPVLVSATDGVGTKLKIAHAMGIHDTVGIDLVAMQVNDVIVQGAEPLFFLDYYACGHLDVDAARAFIGGVAEGCRQSGCALIGGETAEMPGMYSKGDYDVAGFVVGAVERDRILPRLDAMQTGDVLLGLASSGVHSNGFSLVRKIIERQNLTLHDPCPFETSGTEPITLGQALLTPTRIYVRALLPLLREEDGIVKAMAHITGGGFSDNVPRVLPKHLGVNVDAAAWPLPPVFRWLKEAGGVANVEMARTFNCGIGMVLVVDAARADKAMEMLRQADSEIQVYRIGEVCELSEEADTERVTLINTETAW